jgi:hypothetical protein
MIASPRLRSSTTHNAGRQMATEPHRRSGRRQARRLTRALIALCAPWLLNGCIVVSAATTAASVAVGAVGVAADVAIGTAKVAGAAAGAAIDAAAGEDPPVDAQSAPARRPASLREGASAVRGAAGTLSPLFVRA